MTRLMRMYAVPLADILARYCNDTNGAIKCFTELEEYLRKNCPHMFEEIKDADGNSIGR